MRFKTLAAMFAALALAVSTVPASAAKPPATKQATVAKHKHKHKNNKKKHHKQLVKKGHKKSTLKSHKHKPVEQNATTRKKTA